MAQAVSDIVSRWGLGFNMGYYHANRYQANFYNGTANNENTIGYVFNNKYQYQEIFTLLNATDTLIITGLPMRMSYQPAVSLGFSVRYHITPRFDWFTRFNYVRLHTSDYFTVDVDPNTFPTFPDIRLYDIYGTEERMLIDMGFTLYKEIGEQSDWFVEGGFDLNNTDVKENKIRFENKEYSIIDLYGGVAYTPNLPLQEYPNEQGGLGYGLFAGGGIRVRVNDNVGFEPGLNVYAKKIELPGYATFRPHFLAYVRLTMGMRDSE